MDEFKIIYCQNDSFLTNGAALKKLASKCYSKRILAQSDISNECIGGSKPDIRTFFKPWSQALSRAELLVRQSMLRINY